jgi:hypothetical protein
VARGAKAPDLFVVSFNASMPRLLALCIGCRRAGILAIDAFRGIQYHIQHFFGLGEHRDVTGL